MLHDGHHVRTLTRIPEARFPDSVEKVYGELSDVDPLEPAFSGVEAIDLITIGGADGADLSNGAELIALAEDSGITRATMLAGWAPTSVEKALETSSLTWCRIEPVEVMYNPLRLV